MKIIFSKDDPIELDRAKRAVTDMLKRGFVLFVHGEGKEMYRVLEFDPAKEEYVIADVPCATSEEPVAAKEPSDAPEPAAEPTATARGRAGKKRVPMSGAKVTSVGRSAGG